MNYKLTFIILGLAITLAALISLNFGAIVKSNLCAVEEDYKQTYVNGLVIEKFIDHKNHSAKKLIVSNKHTKSIFAFALNNDTTQLYPYALVGDSLYKPKGSLSVKIIRKGSERLFKVSFACK